MLCDESVRPDLRDLSLKIIGGRWKYLNFGG
jgi:hypothetical protein